MQFETYLLSGLHNPTSFVSSRFLSARFASWTTNVEYGLPFRCDSLLLQFHRYHPILLASFCYVSLGSVSLQLVCFLSSFFLLHLISLCFAFPLIPGILGCYRMLARWTTNAYNNRSHKTLKAEQRFAMVIS